MDVGGSFVEEGKRGHKYANGKLKLGVLGVLGEYRVGRFEEHMAKL